MNRDELLDLRNQAIRSTQAIVASDDVPAEVRLPVLLELVRDGDLSMLKRAYETAQQVEDPGIKLGALLDIVSYIDENIARMEQGQLSERSST